MTDNSRPASIIALMGATGAGKSTAIRLKLDAEAPRRLMVFDPKGEYLALGDECASERAAYRIVSAAGHVKPFRLVFRPSFDIAEGRRQFDWFCRVAYAARDVLVVADELHQFMLAGWAPAGWRRVISMGRSQGVRVIAASQRPADIEKGFWDQATVIRAGRLNGEASARTIAGVLFVPWSEVVALPDLHFIQRSTARPVITWGCIEWVRGRPVERVIREKSLIAPAPA